MKAVYVRPNCLSLLEELGKIASISVWSSMRNLERRGRCKLPVPEREVAMPRASAGFVHDSKVPGLLWTTDHLYDSWNAEGVVSEKSRKLIFIKMRQNHNFET